MMTFEIVLVLLVLGMTVVLFVSEWLRVDVIAIFVMLILAWLKLVTPAQAFSGFAGNAVISIIAVMILGYGVDRSGVMQRLTGPIVKLAGTSQSWLTLVISTAVGLISAFMQNIGATALFLPALLRISRNTRIPASRLLIMTRLNYAGITLHFTWYRNCRHCSHCLGCISNSGSSSHPGVY